MAVVQALKMLNLMDSWGASALLQLSAINYVLPVIFIYHPTTPHFD
ncbi:MAG: hypothetical protein JWP80_4785 [Pseudomonas sp.]|nr:hypothetical protein [Pseudomonas sp.]